MIGNAYTSIIVACFAFFAFASEFCLAIDIKIFAGPGHETFLGVLNAEDHRRDSIWNEYREFGSTSSRTSIWNRNCPFGGSRGPYSPFNKQTLTPPVLVDDEGNFYGYMTANEQMEKRSQAEIVILICDNWEDAIYDREELYEAVKDLFQGVVRPSSHTKSSLRAKKLDKQQKFMEKLIAENERTKKAERGDEERIWRTKVGKSIRAQWSGISNDKKLITLYNLDSRKPQRMAITNLSKEDQEYIKKEIARRLSEGYVIKNGWWYKPD